MLTIYTDLSDVTKDEKFIKDVDTFFGSNVLNDDSFTRMVLSRIEKGAIFRDNIFTDRSGVRMYTQNLSTGSKILLSTKYYPEYIFNGVELGRNAGQLLSYLDSGSIFIANRGFYLEENELELKYSVDDIICNSVEEVNDIIGG